MRAVVLVAGKGARLKEIGLNIPKPMLKFKGKPILEYNIKLLKNCDIKEIYINLHYLPRIVKNYFKTGEKLGVKISYSHEPKILGTAGGVKKIAGKWKEDFLVLYGDNLFYSGFNLNAFIKAHKKYNAAGTIGFYRVKGDLSQKGIAVLNKKNRILKFIEKPKSQPPSNLVNAGIYILSPTIMRYIPNGFSDFGRDIFPKLLKRKKLLCGFIFKEGKLIAVDTPELYKKHIKT